MSLHGVACICVPCQRCQGYLGVLRSDTEAMAAMMTSSEATQGLWEAGIVLHHPHSFPQKAITPMEVHW